MSRRELTGSLRACYDGRGKGYQRRLGSSLRPRVRGFNPITSTDLNVAGVKQAGPSAQGVLTVVTLSHLTQHLYAGIPVLYPAIMAALGISYTELGIATGIASATGGMLQLLFSLLTRFASRRLLLAFGNFVMSLGTLLVGLIRGFYDFVAANVVGAAGTAPQHPVGVSIIADRYERDMVGGALGVHYGLGYIGNVLSPILLTAVAVTYGWRQALYVLAIPPALTALLVTRFLPGERRGEREQGAAGLARDVRSALHVKGAVAVVVAQALLSGSTGMGSMVTYTPLFLVNELRVNTLETGAYYALSMFAGVLGTLLIGRYSDRFGHLRTAMVSAVVTSTATFLLGFYTSANLLLVPHLFIMGLTGFSITSVLQAYLSAVAQPAQRDILFGVFFTVGFGFGSVWAVVIGVILDTYGLFAPAWTLMAALGLVSTLILWRGGS